MATETASLVIKVDSSGADRATRSLDKLDRAAGGSERAANKLGKAWGIALGIIGSAVVAGATREYIRAADAMANMGAKLKLVTGSTEAATKAQRQLFELSQATSSDLEATTDLYVKLGQSNKDLAANSELLLGITEKVSKALVISGADAASSAAVIRQFSQAMGAGALRGDEFISVMEGAPRLAQAIADGLGKPIGALRDLAAQGELTSETIIKALENQGDVLDREFGEMPLTVGRATQQVRNALTQLIGDTDKATGASGDLATAIADMARVLESEDTKRGFATLITALSEITGLMVKGTSAAGNYAGELNRVSNIGAELLKQGQKEGWAALLEGDWEGARRAGQKSRAGLDYLMWGEAPDFSNVTDGRERWQNVVGGSSSSRAGGTASATEAVKEKTRAVKELTEAERAWLEFEQDMLALQEESAQSSREYASDQIQAAQAKQEAIERGIAATDQLIADMEFERSLIGMTNIEREKAIALRWADANATDGQRAAIAAMAEDTAKLREAQQFIDDIKGATTNFAVEAAMNLGRAGDAFDNFADRLKRIALQMLAEKAIQWLFGAMFGGNFAGASTVGNGDTAFGFSSYGGGRASGGPVMAGQSYLVGEKGRPEIFTPGTSGSISQAGSPPAKSAPTIVQVINHSGSEARTERSKGPEGGDIIKVIVGQAVDKVNEGIMRQGGSTNRAIAQTFGLSRSGVPVSG